MGKHLGKGRRFADPQGHHVQPLVSAGDHGAAFSEFFLPVFRVLHALRLVDGYFHIRLFRPKNIGHNGHVASDHIPHMVEKVHVLGLDVALHDAGHQDLRAVLFLNRADQLPAQAAVHMLPAQHPVLIEAQAAVFADIADFLPYRPEQPPEVRILPSAGGEKQDAPVCQTLDQAAGIRLQRPGAV